jgi:acyl carrier protein
VETSDRALVREFIVSSCLSGDDRGLDDQTDLQQIGVLDSFTMLALVAFLERTFNIQLDPPDINSETFRSVDAILRLVADKKRPDAGGAMK